MGVFAVHDENPIDTIIRHEGGFVNRKEDRGGPTKYGITQAVLSEWLRRPASVEDVKALTEEEAREIYEIRYLTGPRIHLLPDPPQTILLDMAVNHGPAAAIKIAQRVVNAAGFGPIDVDGVLGPQSREAIAEAQEQMGPYFQNAIVDERVKLFNAIVRNDPSQAVFLKGWLARAASFKVPTNVA